LREKDYGKPYLYNCFMIFPANLVDTSTKGTLGDLARKTCKRVLANNFWESSCWAIVKAVQAARLGDAKSAWRILRSWGGGGDVGQAILKKQRWVNDVNGLMNWHGRTVMQIDGTTSFPAGINETLLQSQLGIIRLFPAVPKSFTGAFHGLRTVGGFLVSAGMKKGRMGDVVIKSTLGGPCTLADTFDGRRLAVREVAPRPKRTPYRRNAKEKSIVFETRRGSVYRIKT
jgi:alpha-L-fucosidase 2